MSKEVDVVVPPNPPPVVPPTVDQNDYVVITFTDWHISPDFNPRHLASAHLWLTDIALQTIQHIPIDGRGFVEMNLPRGHSFYWSIYPDQEFGNQGECYSLRNAGTFVADIPKTITTVTWGICDIHGVG